jgi:hypothetical protein
VWAEVMAEVVEKGPCYKIEKQFPEVMFVMNGIAQFL